MKTKKAKENSFAFLLILYKLLYNIVIPYPYEIEDSTESNFRLDGKTSSEQKVDVTVYDIAGRLIEVRQVNVSELSNQEIGNNYPSGVFTTSL